MKKGKISIAVDGPSGAGKSTLSRRVAEVLGLSYVDTGAIYRTVGLSALRRGVDPTDSPAVESILPDLSIELRSGDDGLQHMILNGEDVTSLIRTDEVSRYASDVSAHAGVRDFLLDMQRSLSERYDVIMDGRDIGTVVLPHASLKIFLTATPEARAKRRYDEYVERGEDVTYEGVLEALRERDRNDEARAVAPLRPAEDAVVLDTTGNSFSESEELMLNLIRERLCL